MRLFDRRSCILKVALFLIASLLVALTAQAGPNTYTYVTWTKATSSGSTTSSPGSASGTLAIGTQTVNVSYTGDVAMVNDYPSLTEVGSAATFDYWNPTSTFTNATVANVPANDSVIGLDENPAFTNTITFSLPVVNPIMDILSLGNGGSTITYTFSATPILLGQGPQSNFGGCSACLVLSGNSLSGTEGDGVIEFVGTFSSISWTTSGANDENGFTIGVLGVAAVPSISANGVVPINSMTPAIQQGEWVSIFGSNLAATPTMWDGNFPESLGGTSVTIDNKPAYLWYVSPAQINLQAPEDTTTGPVAVVVTTAGGSATTTVTLAEFGPSFNLYDHTHVAGIIVRHDGSGAYGGGTYDVLGPTGNSLGFPTVAAKAGDSVELYGVGFGPTNPAFPAGQALPVGASGLATNPIQLVINGTALTPEYAGITEAGTFQLNLTIPAGLGTGDVPLTATVGGVQTPSGIVISLQ